MKLLLFAAILFFSSPAIEAFDKMTTIAGVWKMETSKGSLYEEWKVTKPGIFSGRSYKTGGNDTVFLEDVTVQVADTSLYYIPIVHGQNNGQPVTFRMISNIQNTFTFENKQHDFPQRVIYRIVNDDSMTARIEGVINGKLKFSEFFYHRVK